MYLLHYMPFHILDRPDNLSTWGLPWKYIRLSKNVASTAGLSSAKENGTWSARWIQVTSSARGDLQE